jgi:mono/diheme cytochrome c family protein
MAMTSCSTRTFLTRAALAAVLAACGQAARSAPPPASPVAASPAPADPAPAPAPVAAFDWSHLARLHDARGAHASSPATPLASAQAAVVAFVGTDCPLSIAYLPKLNALSDAYGKRGVAFFAVYSNAQDGEKEVAAHAAKLGLRFAAVKDDHNTLADELHASTTPEVYVVSPRGETLYHGQIDDQYGLGFHKAAAKEWYLANALDDVLAGKRVGLPETTPQGCSLSRERTAPASGAVTYTHDVAPIFADRCRGCHAPGQIAPMPLLTYDDAFAWAGTIRARVASKTMPPWGADGPAGVFRNDVHLTDDQIHTVLQWVDEGAPRGDGAEPAPPAAPVAASDAPGDIVVSMPKDFDVPASGILDWQYVWSDQTFDHDVWVRAARTMPGAPDVVHHVITFVVYPQDLRPGMTKKSPWDAPGRMLSLRQTPMNDLDLPPGYAKKIPKGSRMYFEVHYTPNGVERHDRTRVALTIEPHPKKQVIEVAVLNQEIDIPAFDPNHEETAELKMPVGGEILSLFPHTHLRGKDFRYEVVKPDGSKESLVWIPKYDFYLNQSYNYAAPFRFEKGSVFRCTAHYDNSAANANNPDPTREVKWGAQTSDEMMVGFLDVSLDVPFDSKEVHKYDLAYPDWSDTAKRTAVYH